MPLLNLKGLNYNHYDVIIYLTQQLK
eukprot:Gb_23665 [translate_table: standard]